MYSIHIVSYKSTCWFIVQVAGFVKFMIGMRPTDLKLYTHTSCYPLRSKSSGMCFLLSVQQRVVSVLSTNIYAQSMVHWPYQERRVEFKISHSPELQLLHFWGIHVDLMI